MWQGPKEESWVACVHTSSPPMQWANQSRTEQGQSHERQTDSHMAMAHHYRNRAHRLLEDYQSGTALLAAMPGIIEFQQEC